MGGEQLKYKTNDIVIPLSEQNQSVHAFLSLQQQNVNKRMKQKKIDQSSRCSTEAFVCVRSTAASLKRHHRERERREDGASTATFVASRREQQPRLPDCYHSCGPSPPPPPPPPTLHPPLAAKQRTTPGCFMSARCGCSAAPIPHRLDASAASARAG